MRVLSFSQNARVAENRGWHRMGQNIIYAQNQFKRDTGNYRSTRKYYTLTFEHTFESDDDQVYFAHCFPYTYSDLCEDLTAIEKDRFS